MAEVHTGYCNNRRAVVKDLRTSLQPFLKTRSKDLNIFMITVPVGPLLSVLAGQGQRGGAGAGLGEEGWGWGATAYERTN